MDVLRTKNSRMRAFSIDIQVLTDYFLNRTQVNSYLSDLSPPQPGEGLPELGEGFPELGEGLPQPGESLP
jgi:hypothetical protein